MSNLSPKEHLLRVKSHILDEPRRLRMTTWVQKAAPGDKINVLTEKTGDAIGELLEILTEEMAPPCHTVACIAGWIAILEEGNGFCGGYKAKKLLKVTLSQAYSLFYVQDWPNRELAARYVAAKTPEERAKFVAQRIDDFIIENNLV